MGVYSTLKPYKAIPNKTLAGLYEANDLYDSDVQLFHEIFTKDEFLASALQDDPTCLNTLGRMGLNREYNRAPRSDRSDNSTHDQKDILSNNLAEFLRNGSKHHDVKFIVKYHDGENGKKEFNTNKYMLSAASKYFEKKFDESAEEREIIVPDDIKPESIEILLLWLYGKSFEEAKESVIEKLDNFDLRRDFVPFLINILKVSEIYKVEKLKDTIENIIEEGQYMNINDVYEILKCPEKYNVQKLRKYYEECVKSNKEIFNRQLEQSANDEIDEMSILFKPLLEE